MSADTLDGDVDYSSNGLEQCLDLVKAAMRQPRDTDRAAPPGWLTGEGVALTMIHTVPPKGHIVRLAHVALRDDGSYDLTFGTAEFGNGTTTVHCQIAATALGTTVDRIEHPPVRHRQWRTRHRRLWQHRHGGGRARHPARRGSVA